MHWADVRGRTALLLVTQGTRSQVRRSQVPRIIVSTAFLRRIAGAGLPRRYSVDADGISQAAETGDPLEDRASGF